MQPGEGRVSVHLFGEEISFSELTATYPLKLISSQSGRKGVALVYFLSYGGGLVGGDRIALSVDVSAGAILVILSQGSTKVFRTRPGRPLIAGFESLEATTQRMDVRIASGGGLFLLPDAVTCFRSASYNQVQTFRLEDGASLVLLDWITSGRKALGEDWVLSRYYSANEVWIGEGRLARDVLLLEEPSEVGSSDAHPPLRRTLRDRLAPYSCYAMVILCGPMLREITRRVSREYEAIAVFKTKKPDDVIWSFSQIAKDGCVIRVAGKETEGVKSWLGMALKELEEVVGIDTYRKAFF